jgi:deoxyribodipyrimidine photo-lyase
MAGASIVWFRQDLRLTDNPALAAALRRRGPVIPLFIWDQAGKGQWKLGGASKWWLHHSLSSLNHDLETLGSRLIVRSGDSADVLLQVVEQTGADAVYWNRCYEPQAIQRDSGLKEELRRRGITADSFNALLLFEPFLVKNRQGAPFQVFTPFWRQCLSLPVPEPTQRRPRAGELPMPSRWPSTLSVADLGLLPTIPWDSGLQEAWQPGERAALQRLKFFLRRTGGYEKSRDRLDQEGSSRLSPHLHFGEIGPRQIWTALRKQAEASGVFPADRGVQKFLSELGWREFAYHLLFHFPHTPEKPLRSSFQTFPWRKDDEQFRAWSRGKTGYPIVDAGMRQLWQTGWLPNRVRMVCASFLVKHLRISWREGAAWFWDTLVDADLANNTLGWQWIAGSGADASPYFRIFAPVTQAKKFDPEGDYVRRWVPEIARLPTRFIHEPWTAPTDVLESACIRLGQTYPRPLVDHAQARQAALDAYQRMRATTSSQLKDDS